MDTDTDPVGLAQAPLANFLTYRLAKVQSKLNAQASRILRDHAGLTITQWRIIAVLGDGGRCTSAQLSRMTAMDKGLISRNVKSLSNEGYLSITRDEADNRALHLDLTDKGREIFERTMPRMQARQQALRSYIDPTQIVVLMQAFDALERAAEDPNI
ncbi:MarR family winged helix-turn-helix transcriptional regulator [Mameliella alba]|nr:MarR family winged helix-turn-helix transcriptional regulator [Antarctobacter heliothermus]MBY6144911.1 MarR family winged helix-turn-helix transcriptional regulator [Mameliella alba]MCA0956011.1 MarR family winged helix-turn-helix transcriptional regulator [Mameliella alba]